MEEKKKGGLCHCLALKQSKYKTSRFGNVNTGYLLACLLVILLTVSFFLLQISFPNVFSISLKPAYVLLKEGIWACSKAWD